MNQQQLKQRMAAATMSLKMAAQFSEEISRGTISPENITSLWQLSGKAHSAINALKSEVCGNEPPKIG